MRSAPSFWKALRKRLLITRKRPWQSLMSLASTTPSPRAHQHPQHYKHERRARPPSHAAKRQAKRPALPDLPFQNRPASRWQDAPVTKDQESIHGRGINGEASHEGWVATCGHLRERGPSLSAALASTQLFLPYISCLLKSCCFAPECAGERAPCTAHE